MNHLSLNLLCFLLSAGELHDVREASHDLFSQMIEDMQDILTTHWHMGNLLRLIVSFAVSFLVWTALHISSLPHVFANLFLDIGGGFGIDFFELRLYEEFPG